MGFVIEIFDRFVIDQAVDGLGVGFVIALVHFAAEFHPPFGHDQGKGDINHDGHKRDQRKPEIIQRPQNGRDHENFKQGRQDVEQHEGQQEFNPLDPTFNCTRKPAHLAIQMKPQGQTMQVLKHAQRRCPNGALCHLGKDRVTQFAKGRYQNTHQAIANNQRDRQNDQGCCVCRATCCCFAGFFARPAKGIDGVFVQHGHIDIGDLCPDQKQQGNNHTRAKFELAARP